MTWPQHRDPSKSRRAKAPYNFVPLPDKVMWAAGLPDMDVYHPNRYTGWLDCTLTTSSPLYIRAGLTPEQAQAGQEAKDQPDFFYTDPHAKTPVIPGSSLRGMLRNLIEIVSYSKMQPVTEEKLVYRAVGDTTSLGKMYRQPFLSHIGGNKYKFRVKAGYMHRDGNEWVIVPAQHIKGESFARIEANDIPRGLSSWKGVKNAYRAYVVVDNPTYHTHNKKNHPIALWYAKVSQISPSRRQGFKEVVLVRTGRVPRKHLEFIFAQPDNDGKVIPISKKMRETYLNQITDAQVKLLDNNNGVFRDWQPVFYLLENNELVFFGHPMMFRLPYSRAPRDLVPEVLRDPHQTDLAEGMFGYVEEADQDSRPVARAGRIFVTDATLLPGQSDIWLSSSPITPKILASPKPTTFQHYLVQTSPNNKRYLKHYGSPTPDETVIRGHKLYWHKGEVTVADIKENEKVEEDDKQHTRIRPLRSGVRFHCRLYFENLDAVELGALLWLLDVAADEQYRLKLGMGKPLGLGAVKIESQLHLTDRRKRYRSLFEGSTWATGERDDIQAPYQESIQAFEQWILNDRVLNPNRASRLRELPRIQMLLFLLSWPGPDKEKTRYLEIEHQENGNEYKDRPVLPTPSGVIRASSPTSIRKAGGPSTPRKRETQRANRSRRAQADTSPHVKEPRSTEEIQEGDLLRGSPVEIDMNRQPPCLIVDLGVTRGTLPLEHLLQRLSNRPELRGITLDELCEDTGIKTLFLKFLKRHSPFVVRVHKRKRGRSKSPFQLHFERWDEKTGP